MKNCNWVSIGCRVIANELAQAMAAEGRTLYGIANRTCDKAAAFAAKYGVGKVYPAIDEVFSDPAVDILYISTPHNTHAPLLEKALKSGKHVLCEKSITLNSGELEAAVSLAEERGLVLAEAMTLYHMPLYKKLRRLAESGTLGPLGMLQLNFGSYKEYDMTNRFFNPKLAGGALLDIGVYALSFARWFMSEAPRDVLSQMEPAPSGVDERAGILLRNPAGELATVALSLHAKQPKRGMAAFDRAYLEVYEYPRAQEAVLTWTEDGRREVIREGNTADALRYEIRDMERAVAGEGNEMCLDYTRDVMAVMTRLRRDWGLVYPEEG